MLFLWKINKKRSYPNLFFMRSSIHSTHHTFEFGTSLMCAIYLYIYVIFFYIYLKEIVFLILGKRSHICVILVYQRARELLCEWEVTSYFIGIRRIRIMYTHDNDDGDVYFIDVSRCIRERNMWKKNKKYIFSFDSFLLHLPISITYPNRKNT